MLLHVLNHFELDLRFLQKNAVNAPKNATINKVELLNSNNIEHRIIKKTPAVTKVAAWINAETGVGPSIASGNHIWSPNCADFPRAPQNNKKSMRDILSISKDKKEKVIPVHSGASAKTVQ